MMPLLHVRHFLREKGPNMTKKKSTHREFLPLAPTLPFSSSSLFHVFVKTLVSFSSNPFYFLHNFSREHKIHCRRERGRSDACILSLSYFSENGNVISVADSDIYELHVIYHVPLSADQTYWMTPKKAGNQISFNVVFIQVLVAFYLSPNWCNPRCTWKFSICPSHNFWSSPLSIKNPDFMLMKDGN